MEYPQANKAWLDWYKAIGVDEALSDHALNRLTELAVAVTPPAALAPQPSQRLQSAPRTPSAAPLIGAGQAGADAASIAAKCSTLAELAEAVAAFTGCPLRTPATRTVFSDGPSDAPVMVIGEAPGAEEDRLGKPFVGPSGRLLDQMLAAIGLNRQHNVYITNVIFWRPPANRAPTPIETAICWPFVERQIALLKPRVLILSGSVSARTVLSRTDGITKFRGRWITDSNAPFLENIATIATFHPSYLLRSPGQKRETWKDILLVKMKLQELGILP